MFEDFSVYEDEYEITCVAGYPFMKVTDRRAILEKALAADPANADLLHEMEMQKRMEASFTPG